MMMPGADILAVLPMVKAGDLVGAITACHERLERRRPLDTSEARYACVELAVLAADLIRKSGGDPSERFALLEEGAYLARRWPDVQAWLRVTGHGYLLAMNHGVAAAELGRWQVAVEAHRRALDAADRDETRAKSRVYLGWNLLHLGGLAHTDQALAHFALVRLPPLRPAATAPIVSQALQGAAACLYARGDHDGARAALNEAVTIDPASPRARRLLTLCRAGALTPEAFCDAATSGDEQPGPKLPVPKPPNPIDPTKPTPADRALIDQINALLGAGDHAAAIARASEWLARTPRRSWIACEAHLVRSRTLLRAGRAREGIPDIFDALAIATAAPDDAFSHLMRAQACDQLAEAQCIAGNAMAAVASLHAAEAHLARLETPPRLLSADIHHTLGMALSALGQWQHAHRHIETGLDLFEHERSPGRIGCACDFIHLTLRRADTGQATPESLQRGLALVEQTLPHLDDASVADRVRLTGMMLRTRLDEQQGVAPRLLLPPWLRLYPPPPGDEAPPTTGIGRLVALMGLGDAAIRVVVGDSPDDATASDLRRIERRLRPPQDRSEALGSPVHLASLVLRLRLPPAPGDASVQPAEIVAAIEAHVHRAFDRALHSSDGAVQAGLRDRTRAIVDVVAAAATRGGSRLMADHGKAIRAILDRGRPRRRSELIRSADGGDPEQRRALRGQISVLRAWQHRLDEAGRTVDTRRPLWGVATAADDALADLRERVEARYPDLLDPHSRDQLRTHLALLELRLAAMTRPAPLTTSPDTPAALPDIVERRGADECILEYHIGVHGLLAVVVGAHAIHFVPLDVRPSVVKELLDKFGTALEDGETGGVLAQTLDDVARHLLPPELCRLLPDRDGTRLGIVPDGMLWSVPFPWLRVDGAPLFCRHAPYLLPAAALAGPTAAELTGDGVIACHAPSFEHALDEIERVRSVGCWAVLAEHSGADPVVPAHVLTALRDRHRVHIIGHGAAHDMLPSLSALEFASVGLDDGHLTLGDIAATECRAELVYLSACCGATMKTPDGLTETLAHSLLSTGARWVVGSLWRCPDADAPVLAETFYRTLDALGDVALAHRESLRAVWSHRAEPADSDALIKRFGHSVLIGAHEAVGARTAPGSRNE